MDSSDADVLLRKAQADLRAARASVAEAEAGLALTRQRAPAALAKAEAAVISTRAMAQKADADERRYNKLFERKEIPKQLLEQTQATHRSLRAKVEGALAQQRSASGLQEQIAAGEASLASARASEMQAEAAVDAATLQVSYTHVRAPSAGFVTRKRVLPGSHLAAGSPAVALVGSSPWVVANFKETQLENMRVGQPVHIEIDAYPGKHFKGRIDSLQSGTGSAFSLLPPENASGNFGKVVQRVPVKIVFVPGPPDGFHLAPGMSVAPRVDVGAAPETDFLASQ